METLYLPNLLKYLKIQTWAKQPDSTSPKSFWLDSHVLLHAIHIKLYWLGKLARVNIYEIIDIGARRVTLGQLSALEFVNN